MQRKARIMIALFVVLSFRGVSAEGSFAQASSQNGPITADGKHTALEYHGFWSSQDTLPSPGVHGQADLSPSPAALDSAADRVAYALLSPVTGDHSQSGTEHRIAASLRDWSGHGDIGVNAAAAAAAVPTFHSIGVYWSPPGGSSSITARVEYRVAGASAWRLGHPLWFDERNGEYRGSLVDLLPGTPYEIRLSLEGTTTSETLTATTWQEGFPIGRTVYLPELSEQTLTINDTGTSSGYVLYTAQPGKPAVIDVGGSYSYNIRIYGSYIIVRGLTLRHASVDAIRISGSSHDVVIDSNSISNWGPTGSSSSENRAAVYADSGAGPRLIIQNNSMFDPNGNSNDWNSGHPSGPKAIYLVNSKGNLVIRDNRIYSGPDHYFNDGIGGQDNAGPIGNVYRDSDIYGNEVSQCWDDGLEIEGDNINVRIWDNRISNCYVGIAMSSTAVGPLYVYRNLVTNGSRSTTQPSDACGFKIGDSYGNYGATYLYHNTIAGPNAPRCGACDWGGEMRYVTGRNNIFGGTGKSVNDDSRSSANSFDYDLYNGGITAVSGTEAHGVAGSATFEAGSYDLAMNSLGLDQGVVIPGFNDDYQGLAPDMGAYERGDSGAPTFVDVPFSHPYHDDIEALYRAGYTAGCNTDPLMYCPEQTMNRAESSVFVERGIHSASYEPGDPTAQVFADMPLDSWAAKWVNGLWEDQYTAGCGTNPLVYCPWQGHTRAEGCVFYMRMLNGAEFMPATPTVQTFVDVPLQAWYVGWVQAAYGAGLIEPCQTTPELRFCPDDPLTRAIAAHMMVKAKGVVLP